MSAPDLDQNLRVRRKTRATRAYSDLLTALYHRHAHLDPDGCYGCAVTLRDKIAWFQARSIATPAMPA